MNRWRGGDIPAETPASRAMSKDLKRRGFRFVGPTVCYAFMQATGMVNDHVVDVLPLRRARGTLEARALAQAEAIDPSVTSPLCAAKAASTSSFSRGGTPK